MKTQASGNPLSTKSRFLATLIPILCVITFSSIARAALTTNNWTDGSSKWELGSNWSAGTPSLANVLDSITINFPSGLRVIAIDQTTISSNAINGCLSVSNLMISGTSMSPNSLSLNNTSGTPLHFIIANTLSVSSHGIVSISNAFLNVGSSGTGPNPVIVDDGVIVVNDGTLVTPNTINAPLEIGETGTGQMTIQSGLIQSYWILVGQSIYGNQGVGTLTIAGGTVINNVGNGLSVGGGAVWITGGQLLQTNSSTDIYSGQMTISNGLWLAGSIGIGIGQGTLTIAGGSVTAYSFGLGSMPGPTNTMWMTGGTLLTPGGGDIGDSEPGNMTISNGTWLADYAIVGDDSSEMAEPGTGTVSVAGGTILFSSLHMGLVSNCLGSVWLTGGSLTVTNDKTYLGEVGDGHITVSNGTFVADEIDVGASLGALGILTAAGGQVIVTNGAGRIALGVAGSDVIPVPLFGSGQGHMIISAGFVVTRELDVGFDNSPDGQLTISSTGSLTVLSRMTVGDCDSNGFGIVVMTGGKLYVTNATHDAVLEVRNGLFFFDGGTLVVDKLVVTNGCSGTFDHGGGTLTIGTLVLDPNGDADGDGLPNWWEQQHGLDPLSSTGDNGADGDPDGDGYSNWEEYLAGSDPQNPLSTPLQIIPPPFQITSIVRSGNNIVLTWMTAGGTTNEVQVTSGGSGGAFSTNGFTILGAQMLIGGSGVITANYTDVGGATNKPARYYRVRLVP